MKMAIIWNMENLKILGDKGGNAHKNIQRAQVIQERLQYDRKHNRQGEFKVGDEVWYANSKRDTRKCDKLATRKFALVLVTKVYVIKKKTYLLTGLKLKFQSVMLMKVKWPNTEYLVSSLRGVCLVELRKEKTAWIFRNGKGSIIPDAYGETSETHAYRSAGSCRYVVCYCNILYSYKIDILYSFTAIEIDYSLNGALFLNFVDSFQYWESYGETWETLHVEGQDHGTEVNSIIVRWLCKCAVVEGPCCAI